MAEKKSPTKLRMNGIKVGHSSVESGDFGSLTFEINEKYHTIHIFDKNGDKKVLFKKDIYLFERQFAAIDFESMKDGESALIEGSGDNADLVITVKDGDIDPSVTPKRLPGVKKFLKILSDARARLTNK